MNLTYRLVSVLAGATLFACGSPSANTPGGGDAPTGPETPITGSPGPVEPTGEGAQPVEPGADVVDPVPHGFERVEVASDDRTVTVFYWAGIRDCYGLDRAEVDYGDKAVTLTLYEGRVPGVDACIDLAQSFKTDVVLEEPLAGRKIVDGAN